MASWADRDYENDDPYETEGGSFQYILRELRDGFTKSSNASSLLLFKEIVELLPQTYQGDLSQVRTRMHHIRAMLWKSMATGESAAVATDLPVQEQDTAIKPLVPDKDTEIARLKGALESSQQANKPTSSWWNSAMKT